MRKEVLYVGMDESNHGKTKPRVGEIVVAACSYNRRFWESKKHPNRRDFSQLDDLSNKGIYYYYAQIPHELAEHNYSNLPLVAPFLIEHLLGLRDAPKIKLGLDGRLNRDDREKLSSIFARQGYDVSISNFVKKGGVHEGPYLIYLAHLIANSTIQRSMLEVSDDPHYKTFNITRDVPQEFISSRPASSP